MLNDSETKKKICKVLQNINIVSYSILWCKGDTTLDGGGQEACSEKWPLFPFDFTFLGELP